MSRRSKSSRGTSYSDSRGIRTLPPRSYPASAPSPSSSVGSTGTRRSTPAEETMDGSETTPAENNVAAVVATHPDAGAWPSLQRKRYLQMLADIQNVQVKSTAESLESLRIASRMIPRLFHPYSNTEALMLNISAILNKTSDPDTYNERIRPLGEDVYKTIMKDFTDLMTILSCIRKDIPMWVEDDDIFRCLIGFVNDFACAGRNDDNHTIKTNCLAFVRAVGAVDPPAIQSMDKDLRGWNNEAVARMLCPREWLPEFDADPSGFCHDVRYCRRFPKSSSLPMFLFNEKDPEFNAADATDFTAGLFKSDIVTSLTRGIATGPRNIFKSTPGPMPGPKSMAEKANMKKISIRFLAYTSTVIYYGLSSMDNGAVEHGSF
ncbi:hypothetical protein NM688_g3241 [Phlebia brevispora]|uniref:Uncharacterized protein n=1 Tax=Phlebia brevispora TaxID=194682 RepID=A0ACC1T681_9APHY|nr:hypothetical protein NM688_g3241 [Phlebia brevispora]